MLSTENPPPDLPGSCEISQNKSSSSDERASYDNNNNNNQADLFKSGLDENNPLRKFSIRDYVFNKRGKNIKNNWPFSQKNLQLCLKNGVKDVLPPFQSLDLVRNPTIVKCAVENTTCSGVKLSRLSDHTVGQKFAVDIEKINSSGSQENKDFLSTTTSQSCSDPTEKPEFAVHRASNKIERNTQSPVKTCKLIVKLNNIAEPKSNQDLGVNTCLAPAETMASKVCPVCKTFSSSSNTTLNAHIDQCLSGESTIKWTTNSKVIKHRIKPRKTRLMVDIYETALPCTLEDLDRRNGTNWASNLGFPSEDLEACVEEKNMMYSSVNKEEDISEEGAVYIDSNGTKLRILSKLSDPPPNSNASHDYGPSKLVKMDKGSKILSSRKKKYLVHEHKVLKHSLHGQGSCSPSPNHPLKCPPCGQKRCSSRPSHCPDHQVNNGHQKSFPTEAYKEDCFIAYDEMDSNDLGMMKQCVGSKRTGLKKKINLEHENQHPDKIIKKLRSKNGCSSLSDTLGKRNSASKSQISSDGDPLLATESDKRRDNGLCSSHDEYIEQLCQGKRTGLPLSECRGKKNHLTFSKYNFKQARKDSPSVHECHMDPSNGTENNVYSQSNKKIGINNDSSFISTKTSQHREFSSRAKEFASLRKTFSNNAIPSGSNKLSSFRKKLLSIRHSSVAESKKNLDLKKLRLRYTSGSDEEAVVSQSAIYGRDNLAETPIENDAQMEKAEMRVLRIRKKRGGFVNTAEGDISLKGSETLPRSHGLEIGENMDSFRGDSVPVETSNVLEEVEVRDGAFIAFSLSLNSAFPELSGPSNVGCVSQHYYEAYEGHCPSELVLGGEQDMFCADKVSKNVVAPVSHLMVEMDADEAQRNYFVDVDPIPIPGPPGSFLPSPGRMGSEELQGNSSLTTCKIQSSEDEHEVVDMDLSDSPISAVSAVSNAVAARSDSVSAMNLSVQSHVQHETQRGISEDRIDSVVEGASSFKLATASVDRDLTIHDSRDNLIVPEVSTCQFKSIQPCCCSRKDGALQSDSLNYQESQLLRRRTMTSPSVLSQQKQMIDDPNNKINSFNLKSDEIFEKEPTPESAKNSTNSTMGHASAVVSQNSEAKFPSYGDYESPSPSTSSNPVLRLMGKNLMVVREDENLSPQTRPTQSSMAIEHPGLRLSAINRDEPHSFHHASSCVPFIVDNTQANMPAQHVGFSSLDGFKISADFRPPQLSVDPSTVMFSSNSFGGRFATSSKCCQHTCGCSLIPDQLESKIRLDSQAAYDFEPQLKTAYSSSTKHKEIIILDDSLESEAGFAIKATQCNSSMQAGKPSGASVNAFYMQVPPSKGIVTNKWNCTPEGLSALNPNSLPVHLRSSLYFSPGFS